MTSFRTIKTEALVMGSIRLGEADRIVRLYTREKGRVSAVAKGVRRTTSRIGGRLEPFGVVHVLLYPGRSLYTVTGVDMIRSMVEMREILFRLEAGGRLLETASRLLPEEESNPGAFNLLVRCVDRLTRTQDAMEADLIEVAGVAKLLLLQGFGPELTQCVFCGCGHDLVSFSAPQGGAVCLSCIEYVPAYERDADQDCLRAYRQILESSLSELRLDINTSDVVAQVRRMAHRIMGAHAG